MCHTRRRSPARLRDVVSQNTATLIFLVCLRIPVDFVVLLRVPVDFSVRKVFLYDTVILVNILFSYLLGKSPASVC